MVFTLFFFEWLDCLPLLLGGFILLCADPDPTIREIRSVENYAA